MSDKDKTIDRLIGNSAEVLTEEELRSRLEAGEELTHYIGFEISGYVHIGYLMSALVIKDLQELGVKCTVWLADWHTWINNKLDGSKETAAAVGQGYFTEAIKGCLLAVGADVEKVEFRLASEWYAKAPMKYWETVVAVMQNTSQSRMQRSISIMGREEGEDGSAATLMYPAMQVADILYQEIDIAHAGMDQRKAHVVMRDVADKVIADSPKPIALHHPLLVGPKRPDVWPVPEGMEQKDVITQMKMSKSKADTAIWVHDSEEEITKKINQAFCEEKEVDYNPVLNWAGHVLFWNREKPFIIERKEEHGGDVEFATYDELAKAFGAGEVHPMDLKAAVAGELIQLLQPVRDHFADSEVAATKDELDKVLNSK